MTTSAGPVSPEPVEGPPPTTIQTQSIGAEMQADGPRDVYAEAELELRQERTERMIRRAQEQA